MTEPKKKRNNPLSQLRQTIISLPTTSDNLPLVLYLSALTLIVRNNRLKNLLGETSQSIEFSVSDLRKLVKHLSEQLSAVALGLAEHLDFEENNDQVWQVIWQSLQKKTLDSLWHSEITLGYIYQFLCLPQRYLSLDNLSQSDKTIDATTIIAFTQLYTPDWIAHFLLENTVMPQWNAKLPAEKITILDPACGAGHLLIKAFELLSRLYVAEGASEKEAAKSILKQNLYGVDIDERALAVTSLALLVKFFKTNPANNLIPLNVTAATNSDALKNILGSLNRQWSKDHMLSKRYRVVVTNPPYIGRKLLDRSLKQALKAHYPNSHNDLANAFLERCIELSEPSGMVGLITQASIISLPSYGQLRKSLLEKTLDTCVDLGPGVFPLQGGEKINSLILILKNESFNKQSKSTVKFLDLRQSKDKVKGLSQIDASCPTSTYEISQNILVNNNNYVFNYRSPALTGRFLNEAEKLADLAEVRQGLATTDNARFLRFWWDVDSHSIGQRWFPYAKGAGVKRWHNPIKHLVNWQNDGQEIKDAVISAYPYLKGNSAWVVKNEKFYFRQGLTFSFIGGQDLSVRYLPTGCIFDVAGSAIFVDDQSIFCYLAYLNSSFIRALAFSLNPSINFQVGDLKKLPVLNFAEAEKSQLSSAAKRCFKLKEWLSRFDPTVLGSELPEELLSIVSGNSIEKNWQSYTKKQRQVVEELSLLETQIDQIVLIAAARQLALSDFDLKTLTTWIDSTCPQTQISEALLDSTAFAKISLHQLLQNFLRETPYLTFSTDKEIADEFPLGKENSTWLRQQLNESVSKYLVEKFNAEQARQFSGSPQLFCKPITGNGHAILFSAQTLRDIQEKRKLVTEKTTDMTMLNNLAAKMAQTQDWTGKQLLSIL